jgi:hypothetical protein
MFQYRARQEMRMATNAPGPALPAAPGPRPGVRYALPGECPPSTRPPGTNDNVIERFDLYAQRHKGAPHGR